MELQSNTDNNQDLLRALGYEERLSPSQPFVTDVSTGSQKLDTWKQAPTSKRDAMYAADGIDKSKIQLPMNTARPPVGHGARFVRGPRMSRRGSTGVVHRSRPRRQSGDAVNNIHDLRGDFLRQQDVVMERNDSMRLLRGDTKRYSWADARIHDEEDEQVKQDDAPPSDQVMRIYRRKPRRMSGCAVQGASGESLKTNLPCLLQRENSVHLTQKRIKSRRASMI